MEAATGSWVSEYCSTVGVGPLNLIGAVGDESTFASIIPVGQVWYSIKDGNGNREAGIATFDGAVTLTRNLVHATLVGETYTEASPTPISLTGSSVVSCTFNSEAYQLLVGKINTLTDIATFREYDAYSVANTYYKGWSEDKDTANPTWKILKGVESPPGIFTETFADGDLLYNNIWDNRLGLIYS